MKKLLLAQVAIMSFGLCYAQNCKPSIEQTDKISKEAKIAWESTIYEISHWGPTDWDLRLQLGRYGNNNLLGLFVIQKEVAAEALTQYKGEKGRAFYLAFTSGEALTFTAHVANNLSKINDATGKLETTVSLTCILSNDQINEFKARYDAGTLSAIRISLAGDIMLDKAVNEKKAAIAEEKFNCFYEYNSKHPQAVVQVKSPYRFNLETGVVPEDLPRNETANKISFSNVVEVGGATKDQLYERAQKWMVNYYKNDQFSINNKEEGRLTKSGFFVRSYPIDMNGKMQEEQHHYSLSVFIKDGKYKYEMTDFTGVATDSQTALENVYAMSLKSPGPLYADWKRYTNEQIYTGVQEIITALKKAMNEDVKSDNGW